MFYNNDDTIKTKMLFKSFKKNLYSSFNLLNLGIYVQNLNQFNVTDLKNTMKYLAKGNQSR